MSLSMLASVLAHVARPFDAGVKQVERHSIRNMGSLTWQSRRLPWETFKALNTEAPVPVGRLVYRPCLGLVWSF